MDLHDEFILGEIDLEKGFTLTNNGPNDKHSSGRRRNDFKAAQNSPMRESMIGVPSCI
jgi:hypothetical protein